MGSGTPGSRSVGLGDSGSVLLLLNTINHADNIMTVHINCVLSKSEPFQDLSNIGTDNDCNISDSSCAVIAYKC